MKRKDGYYWVKRNGELLVALWVEGSGWQLPGELYSIDDTKLDYISSKQLKHGGFK